MNLLLDTQALIWWREGNPRLGIRARRAIASGSSTVHVSAASLWELVIKVGAGRLRLKHDLSLWSPEALQERSLTPLDVTLGHAFGVFALPVHHADPFDRLLIAQALGENLTIVTSDSAFEAYGVRLLDART